MWAGAVPSRQEAVGQEGAWGGAGEHHARRHIYIYELLAGGESLKMRERKMQR